MKKPQHLHWRPGTELRSLTDLSEDNTIIFWQKRVNSDPDFEFGSYDPHTQIVYAVLPSVHLDNEHYKQRKKIEGKNIDCNSMIQSIEHSFRQIQIDEIDHFILLESLPFDI